MRSSLVVMTALALAVAGCERPDPDHPQLDYTSSLLNRMSAADIDRLTTPPAAADYGPIPPDANFADPATNASLAFPEGWTAKSVVPPPGSDNSPEGQRLAVLAQDAAAKAPDTASADEAKRKVYEDAARGISVPDAQAKAPVSAAETDQKPRTESIAADTNDAASEPQAAQPDSPSPDKLENI